MSLGIHGCSGAGLWWWALMMALVAGCSEGENEPSAQSGDSVQQNEEDCSPEEKYCVNYKVCATPDYSNGCMSQACEPCPRGGPGTERSCVDGQCAVSCQGGWGDCDGDPSNGCETSLNSLDNCAACGVACDALPHASVRCDWSASSGAQCQLGPCEANYFNLDEDPSNGCEADRQAYLAAICSSIDLNAEPCPEEDAACMVEDTCYVCRKSSHNSPDLTAENLPRWQLSSSDSCSASPE